MARMYARKKGKSGSTKPLVPAQWVEYKKDDVEKLVLKLSKEGMSSAEVGRTLKDQYGIPSTRTVINKRIGDVMTEKNVL